MEDINQNTLLHFLIVNSPKKEECNHSHYYEWNNETIDLVQNLKKIGKMKVRNSSMHNENYWGKNAPIYFNKYPYFSCEIYQCIKCNQIFFHYSETGGHRAQNRYRLIRKELIDLTSIKPETEILVDTKSYEYSIYKTPDLKYRLHTCHTIAGGADIIHILSKQEVQDYENIGIRSLQDRIADMSVNFHKYQVTTWR